MIDFPGALQPNFTMIDVGLKRPTRRYAMACGRIVMGKQVFQAIVQGTLPKGNALALAEAAAVMAAKKTADIIPLCHPLSLEQVQIHFDLNAEDYSLWVYAQALASAKTGVEMEALAAVHAALLTIWDLSKGIDPNLSIDNIRLLAKTGGKRGLWTNAQGIPNWLARQLPSEQHLAHIKAGVVVMSDRASRGEYSDQSGKSLVDRLKAAGASLSDYQIIPDDAATIAETLRLHCQQHQPDLLIACGGTGPGPRDVTPEVLEKICTRILSGFGELLRAESAYHTRTAWLSRMTAGMLGATLIIAFPGSPKAVDECWQIITPFIGDALQKIKQQGYENV